MTFTYDNPNDSDLEAVRFRLQDIDEDKPLLTDEEIEFELAEVDDNILLATLACAEVLVARGAHKVTKKIGQMTINYSDLTDHYIALVGILHAKIQRGDNSFIIPTAGKVADVTGYPKEFETTVLAWPDWEE